MSGIFSLQFVKKVSLFMKSLNRSDTVGVFSKPTSSLQNASFTTLMTPSFVIATKCYHIFSKVIESPFQVYQQPHTNQLRTVTKFSYQKGARKTVKAVPARFYRLHWGIWIRTIAGRHKKLWKKTNRRKNALLSHVFCNSTQTKMLDKMVNRFWRVPKYYIEDPYQVYHNRENFPLTKRKPWRPDGVDYE